MHNPVLFGVGTYFVNDSVFPGPDLIVRDKKKKRVEKVFEKQRVILDQLPDSFSLEYGIRKIRTSSYAKESIMDFVKIRFTMADGKPAQEEVTRGILNWTYASLIRKATRRALVLSNYFLPKSKNKATPDIRFLPDQSQGGNKGSSAHLL